MAQQCFMKPGSNPPTCGVDGAPLTETYTSNPNLTDRFFMCQKSGQSFTESTWYEERGGRLFCKVDEIELEQRYIPQAHKGGWVPKPTFECPKCKREATQS